MNLTSAQRDIIGKVISVFETGSPQGDYGNVTVMHDGPDKIEQVTYGRWQTTEFSNLPRLVKMYVNEPGAAANIVAILRPYVGRIGQKPALAHDNVFINALRDAGHNDPVMRDVQDRFFKEAYFDPAENWADAHGLTEALSALVIYDSFVHSGSIRQDIRSKFPEVPPSNGGVERKWVEAYVKARHSWLANHPNELLHATRYRTLCFQREIDRGNWDLSQLPINANGTNVS